MTAVYDDAAAARRKREKLAARAVETFRRGAASLELRIGYRRNLVQRIRLAKNPGREAQRFLQQLKATHTKPKARPGPAPGRWAFTPEGYEWRSEPVSPRKDHTELVCRALRLELA